MTVAITRKELGAVELRREARRCRDTAASRRMLALALVLEGASRAEAARAAGMDRPTLRDWVHRYDEEGLAGLRDRPRSGRRPRLSPEQEAELAAAVERGPDPARGGVGRGRRVALRALIEARFAVRPHERTVGEVRRRLGFTRLSVRPRPPKADEAAQEAFKKASPGWWRERCPSAPAASRSRSGSRTRPARATRAPCPGCGRGAAPGPGRPATAATPGPTCSARSAPNAPSAPPWSCPTPTPRPRAWPWPRSAATSRPGRTAWSCSTVPGGTAPAASPSPRTSPPCHCPPTRPS